jgi:peptidyl-prolyl cis-trans isomerase D
MLQRMRDGIQGWVAWLIIGALIASLGLLGVNFYLKGGPQESQNVAATVNGATISTQDVSRIYERIKQQNPAAANALFETQQRHAILQSLIDQNLLLWAATQNNFHVSEAELSSTVIQIPQFQDQGKFSQERYLAVLQQVGYTSQSFLANVQKDLLLKQIQAGLSLTDFALPNEAEKLRRLVKQTRSFSYAILPFDAQSAPKMDLSKAVPDYYQAHLSEFQTPEKIQLNYVVLSDQNATPKSSPSEAQLKQFYQENISQYTKAPQLEIAHILLGNENNHLAEAKVSQIQAALKAGKDFSKLASEFSDDLLTAHKGGVLPSMTYETLPPAFQKALKTLKPGQVSEPIQTEQGIEIIQLIASKPSLISRFTEVSVQVKSLYIAQQTQKAFADQIQQLQDFVFQNPDSLTTAAKALHLTIQTSDWLTPTVPGKGLWNQALLHKAAFSDTVKMGNNSDILYPNPHTALVMHVKKYSPAEPIPLKTVEAQIQMILINEARQKLTQAQANSMIQSINAGTSLEKITKQYAIKWNTVNKAERHDAKQKISSLVLNTAFNLPRPATGNTVSAGSILLDKSVALVVVTAVQNPIGKMTRSDEKIYSSQLANYYNQLTVAQLLNFYRHQAKIKILATPTMVSTSASS